jgi:hypothetical protein
MLTIMNAMWSAISFHCWPNHDPVHLTRCIFLINSKKIHALQNINMLYICLQDKDIEETRELENVRLLKDRLCGLVVRVLGYRSRGPGSIPGTTKFSEK